MRRLPVLPLLALALGCRSVGSRPPTDCSPAPATGPVPDSQTVARLVGSYELITVNTAKGYDGYVFRAPLELAVPDSAWRERERRGLGRLRRRTSVLMGRRGPTNPESPRGEMVSVFGAAMTVGCVDCNDASPTWYGITAISESGFAGRWVNRQTGIAIVVDRWGRELPDPEGYFCARRVGR